MARRGILYFYFRRKAKGMQKEMLEIHEYQGEGYKPLIDFNCWRVAVLRYLDELQPDRISYFERHNETDEVFVLLQGQAVLFMGEGKEQVEKIHPCSMRQDIFYNVKRGAWHTVALSRDATILLVENRDTARENSSYFTISPQQSAFLLETVRREIPEWQVLNE
jgi:Fe-S cluster biosynthesis and repair protein YggX